MIRADTDSSLSAAKAVMKRGPPPLDHCRLPRLRLRRKSDRSNATQTAACKTDKFLDRCKTRGPGQEGLLPLPGDLLWPRAARVPVNTPTAKKPKYISAAGCRSSWCNKSGNWKSTFPRLYMPITTSKNRTAMKNTIFTTRIRLIIYRARCQEIQLPGKAPPAC